MAVSIQSSMAPDRDPAFADEYLHRAVAIGAQGADTVPGESAQRSGRRVAEGVAGADRDHRQAWPRVVEQGAEAGVVAAVVGDLEDVDRPRIDRHRLALGVSRQ